MENLAISSTGDAEKQLREELSRERQKITEVEKKLSKLEETESELDKLKKDQDNLLELLSEQEEKLEEFRCRLRQLGQKVRKTSMKNLTIFNRLILMYSLILFMCTTLSYPFLFDNPILIERH